MLPGVRAVRIADYERQSDRLFVGHGVNGKEMHLYVSDKTGELVCGDKGTPTSV